MANLAALATTAIVNLFTAQAGTDFALDAVALSLGQVPAISLNSILTGNTAPELFESSLAVKYPTANVYCDKMANTLKEKFRVFSGTVQVIVELRHSQDQIQAMQVNLETYVTAACQILDEARGDLGNGLFYAGGYEVVFNPVKRGGRNFLQIARISLTLDASI